MDDKQKEITALVAIIGQIINQYGPIELSIAKMNEGLPGKELLIEQSDARWILSLADAPDE